MFVVIWILIVCISAQIASDVQIDVLLVLVVFDFLDMLELKQPLLHESKTGRNFTE